MAREVSYAEQTLDSPNPFTRFAHRSRYRVSLELGDKLLPKGGALLDFGAGEGTYLAKIGAIRPDARLMAIEPYMTIRYPNIAALPSLDNVSDASIDVLGAFEALEHVTDQQLSDFLHGGRRVLKPSGALFVTVPIMYGLTLPVKELSRAILHRRMSDTAPAELLKASLGMPIERAPNRLTSHKGFDFRDLRKRIAAVFPSVMLQYSPFPNLPWWVNSQAIFIARAK